MTDVIGRMVRGLKDNQTLAYTTSYGRILCKNCFKHTRPGEVASPMDDRNVTNETECGSCHRKIRT